MKTISIDVTNVKLVTSSICLCDIMCIVVFGSKLDSPLKYLNTRPYMAVDLLFTHVYHKTVAPTTFCRSILEAFRMNGRFARGDLQKKTSNSPNFQTFSRIPQLRHENS
jgi:hypothetical protein